MSLYLHANGRLAFEPPTERESPYDEYVSDTANPVPYVEQPPTELASDYMYGDQRFASRRSDVLTYRTDPLDHDVTVAGPLVVRLQVSSSGTDSDFVVKLIDESETPGPSLGYQQLVRGEPMRARFRNSFSSPEALQPNEATSINYAMPDINHTFLRGHRIVVQVQSSWFPLTDINPQSFVPISGARPADFVKATQRVFHKPEAASSLVLQLLNR
jgi:putative CocE/NonD family hydrolase